MRSGHKKKPFRATHSRVFLGYFATAVEAAVCYARRVQQQQQRQPEEDEEDEEDEELAAEQAVDADEDGQGEGRAAADGIVLEVEGPDGIVQEAEGLKLHLNPRSASGYRGVTANPDRGSGSRSFRAMAGRVYLGYFATAVEAAVRIARHVQQQEPEAMEEEQEAEQEPEAMEGQEEEEEEDRQRELRVGDAIEGQYGTDKSELWWPGTVTRVWRGGKVDVRYDDGDTELKKAPSRVRRLQLHRSSSSSGYKGVYRTKHGRFEVRLMLGSVDKYLGVFGTALEAAEAYARALALEQEAEAMEEVQEEEEEAAAEAEQEEEEEEQEEEEEAEEAPVQEAEGLQLHLSSRSKTGGQRTFNPPLQYSPRLRHSPAVASLRRLPGRLLSQQLYHCALSNGDQG